MRNQLAKFLENSFRRDTPSAALRTGLTSTREACATKSSARRLRFPNHKPGRGGGLGRGLGVACGRAVGVGLTVPVGVALGVAVGVAVGDAVGVGVGVDGW